MRKLFGLSLLMAALASAPSFTASNVGDEANCEFYGRFYNPEQPASVKSVKNIAWFKFWAQYHGRGNYVELCTQNIVFERFSRRAMRSVSEEVFGAFADGDDEHVHDVALTHLFPVAQLPAFERYHTDFVEGCEKARKKRLIDEDGPEVSEKVEEQD